MGETTATCWLTALKARLPMSSRWCPIRALSVLLNTNLTNCMQVCHNNGLVMWTFDVFFVACLNSLRPSEAIWRPRCGSTLRSSDSHLTEVSFARDTNELTCYMDGIALWKHKSYLQFLWFLNAVMTQAVEILPHGGQGPVYAMQSIPWLLMSWHHEEPEHQQSWCWLSSTSISKILSNTSLSSRRVAISW